MSVKLLPLVSGRFLGSVKPRRYSENLGFALGFNTHGFGKIFCTPTVMCKTKFHFFPISQYHYTYPSLVYRLSKKEGSGYLQKNV